MLSGGIKRSLLFCMLVISLSFTLKSEHSAYGITIKKTIRKVGKHLYEVSIDLHNGRIISGIAKYEARLPLSADFVKEVSKDKTVNFKVQNRKIKVIWMYLRTNNAYSTVFQMSSRKSIKKLKMVGDFYGHQDGRQFSLKDTSSFVVQ